MTVSLAFIQHAYLTIMGKGMPDNLSYDAAAKTAHSTDPKRFKDMHKNWTPPRFNQSL